MPPSNRAAELARAIGRPELQSWRGLDTERVAERWLRDASEARRLLVESSCKQAAASVRPSGALALARAVRLRDDLLKALESSNADVRHLRPAPFRKGLRPSDAASDAMLGRLALVAFPLFHPVLREVVYWYIDPELRAGWESPDPRQRSEWDAPSPGRTAARLRPFAEFFDPLVERAIDAIGAFMVACEPVRRRLTAEPELAGAAVVASISTWAVAQFRLEQVDLPATDQQIRAKDVLERGLEIVGVMLADREGPLRRWMLEQKAWADEDTIFMIGAQALRQVTDPMEEKFGGMANASKQPFYDAMVYFNRVLKSAMDINHNEPGVDLRMEADPRLLRGDVPDWCDYCFRIREGSRRLRCSGCRTASYCSAACQKADWNEGLHKERCIGRENGFPPPNIAKVPVHFFLAPDYDLVGESVCPYPASLLQRQSASGRFIDATRDMLDNVVERFWRSNPGGREHDCMGCGKKAHGYIYHGTSWVPQGPGAEDLETVCHTFLYPYCSDESCELSARAYKSFRMDQARRKQGARFTVCCEVCKDPRREGEGLLRCAECGVIRYCSKECQRKDWPVHRKVCEMMARFVAREAEEEAQVDDDVEDN
ncbi:hypothetical protein DFJ74DRAFT_750926 [Hyaloraphidium curvatum]|nr:hypothetical protein DFJ74DRAFT_750926 [Hyaloraphidium curvatum]